MVRRMICLGALLVVMLTCIPACSGDAKPNPNGAWSTVPDPKGNEVPKPAGRGS
jgi:hypothetical protein